MVLRRHNSTTAQTSCSKSKRHNSASDSDVLFGVFLHTYAHNDLEEAPEFEPCLFVDRSRDALDATAARHATNVRLADAVDVVSQDLSMRRSVYHYRLELLGLSVLPVPLRARLAQAETLSRDTTSTYASDRRLSAGSLHTSRTSRRHVC